MSAETVTETPKKSILTRAMEAVRDKETTETTEEGTTNESKFAYKRLAIGVSAVAGIAAVTTVAIKLFTGQQVEEETDAETPAEPTD